MIMYIRSTIFWIAFFSLTFVLGMLGVVTLLGFFPKTSQMYISISGKLVQFFIRLICGIKIVVKGKENLPNAPFIIASKHESAWETAFFPAIFQGIVIPLKKELIYFPFFGVFMYFYGMIYVDRSSGTAALKKMLKMIAQRVSEGRSILIFPEGTRVKHGQVTPLKSGIVAINRAVPEVPIVPVYLDSGYAWPPRSWLIRGGTITVVFKKPIKGLHSKEELLQKLEKEINSVAT